MLIGNNIKSSCDHLESISVKELYGKISAPEETLVSAVRHLRIMRGLDGKLYQKAKTELPYIVCGTFSPCFRKSENFVCTDSFVLDVDHITEKGFDVQDVRMRISDDSRVALMFTSPSGDGLKILFKLSEKCYDSAKFAVFYKAFASSFSIQYGLEQVVDAKTCDVTRACFLSADETAFYRESPVPVDVDFYVNEDNPFDYQCGAEQSGDETCPFTEREDDMHGPHPDDIEKIKQTLFKKRSSVEFKREVYVPKEVSTIVEGLSKCLADNNVQLDGVCDIQYGKKFQMTCGGKHSEVNVFFGRKGYSVVPTPKRGTDKELNDVLSGLIEFYLMDTQAYA